MSAIYWEQTPVQCAYVSVCTTKACLLLFSLISNHSGATFYYHFLSVPVEHHLHPEGCLFGNAVLNDHFLEITHAGLTAALLKRSAPPQAPVGCITWESRLRIFLKFQSNRCLRLMAAENLPSANNEKNKKKKNARQTNTAGFLAR